MANPKHLAILRQGVEAWNNWIAEDGCDLDDIVTPGNLGLPACFLGDFSGADLSEAQLSGANLQRVNLSGAILTGADLSRARLSVSNLYRADLRRADLAGARMDGADLSEANLSRAKLLGAELVEANLNGANMFEAILSGAYLFGADLSFADLSRASLDGTNFSKARLFHTIFADTNLNEALGLEKVIHYGPSSISLESLIGSMGEIPNSFLRGAGVPDNFIKYASLAAKPMKFDSVFISYSSKDSELAERLHADLQANGVRCWFAPEDLKIGDKLRTEIDKAIRLHDKLLILLSENSVSSGWVEKEVESAFDRENREKRLVLFPIRLDTCVMDAVDGWAADIRRTRHIGDFSKWRKHASYKKAFNRLLRDLKSERPPK